MWSQVTLDILEDYVNIPDYYITRMVFNLGMLNEVVEYILPELEDDLDAVHTVISLMLQNINDSELSDMFLRVALAELLEDSIIVSMDTLIETYRFSSELIAKALIEKLGKDLFDDFVGVEDLDTLPKYRTLIFENIDFYPLGNFRLTFYILEAL